MCSLSRLLRWRRRLKMDEVTRQLSERRRRWAAKNAPNGECNRACSINHYHPREKHGKFALLASVATEIILYVLRWQRTITPTFLSNTLYFKSAIRNFLSSQTFQWNFKNQSVLRELLKVRDRCTDFIYFCFRDNLLVPNFKQSSAESSKV